MNVFEQAARDGYRDPCELEQLKNPQTYIGLITYTDGRIFHYTLSEKDGVRTLSIYLTSDEGIALVVAQYWEYRCLKCDELFPVGQFPTYTVRGKRYRRSWCRACYNAYERPKARARYHARKAREGRALLDRLAARSRAAYQRLTATPAGRRAHNLKSIRWVQAHQGELAFETREQARRRRYAENLRADPVRYARRLEQKRAYAKRKRAEERLNLNGQD